jgi:mono/diheme cytochrome c family protein
MNKLPILTTRFLQQVAIALVGFSVFVLIAQGANDRPAHAFPEYAERTGEPCATCHVNPGGGGPRTLRGLLWAARGRPDSVPELPGSLMAPGVSDGQELYEVACAGCHGFQGEGLSAMGLAGTGVSETAIRSYLLYGIPQFGMPSFEKQLDAAQIDALVSYLGKLSRNEISAPEGELPLPTAEFRCDLSMTGTPCGGD